MRHPNEPLLVFRAPSGNILPTRTLVALLASREARADQAKQSALGEQIARQSAAVEDATA